MPRGRRPGLGTLAALLATLTTTPTVMGQQQDPRLIVILAVDQMRADYVERFRHQWTGGLRRLVDHGAVFAEARYSYFGTLTCAGHATIATGTVPATHGVILDGWWDPVAGRRIRCTADDEATAVRYGPRGSNGHGPSTIMVPTLSDELRAQMATPARVAAFAVKGRAAIPLAGHRADAVAWFDDGNGWTTSTAYSPAPVDFLTAYLAANPVEADRGKVWRPTLGASAFMDPPDGPPEPVTFAHPLPAGGDENAQAFYTAWVTSPYSDEYVGRMAVAAVDALELGQGDRTDYLAIGFSAADYIGHEHGPRSLEVQDYFVRLDATIGRLLDHFDTAVGPNRYVVALSADHGVAPIPEWASEQGFDAGRIGREDVVRRVNEALIPVLGPGEYAAAMTHIEFYFAPGVYDRLRAQPAAMQAALEAIQTTPGVLRVFRGEDLLDGTSPDPLTREVAASYYPGRSGDLVVIPKPYWYTWVRGADHGTGYDYDTRVPLVLMGQGIRAGRYLTPADPADIAPTLATLAGIVLPRPDGRVLTEALER